LSYLPQNPVDSEKKLIHTVLHKFEIQQFKRFLPHLNKVATLHCETWRSRFAREQQLELRTQNAFVILSTK